MSPDAKTLAEPQFKTAHSNDDEDIFMIDTRRGLMDRSRSNAGANRMRLRPCALPTADASSIAENLALNAEKKFMKAQGTLTSGSSGIKVPLVAWTLTVATAAR